MPDTTMMSENAIRSVVIVGGGTAGWMSAAVLARFLQPLGTQITLIESDEIGTIGVGEATVPLIQHFNGVLGIDERDFLKKTNGTYKLGIEFRDWGETGNVHFHGFGDYGEEIEGISPHHHWLKLHGLGDSEAFDDYSLPYAIAKRKRFAPPRPGSDDPAAFYRYAFHFDASLYAHYLRGYAEARGVSRIEGKLADVKRDERGHIAAVALEGGRTFEADLFIDCTGFRALLIGDHLGSTYEDWSKWLPCDRAFAVQSNLDGPPVPYTVSTARSSGWQWRIPLQHRMGNGHVYCSSFLSDEDARDTLVDSLGASIAGEPRQLRFVTGRRPSWVGNCVAVGLSAGFMEPLESTSIQLIQTAIARLIEFFPDRNFDAATRAEYNRITSNEWERIRDFLILHYCLTRRTDSEFWRGCAAMPVPDSLQHKIDVFRACGRVPMLTEESYQEASWTAVFIGNGFLPKRYDPLVDTIPTDRLKEGLRRRRETLVRIAEALPTHEEFVQRFCMAKAA